MGFQTSVNQLPSPAVEGDFASDNPRQAMVAGDTQLMTTTGGLTLGRFAWADANGLVTNAKPGSGAARLGFAAREGQPLAFIQTWLAGASLLVPAGLGITLHTQADVWVRNTVASATVGQKAFASTTDGTVRPGAAGATIAGYVETPWFYTSAAAVGELASLSQGG